MPGRRGSASQTNVSRLPFGPGSPDDAKPSTLAPSRSAAPATDTSAARRSAGSRTTPPFPTPSRPTSNWGLQSARQSKAGAAHASTAGSTFASPMKDTSMVISSGAYGRSSGRRWRALKRSSTDTRPSPRIPHASSP